MRDWILEDRTFVSELRMGMRDCMTGAEVG